MASIRVSTETFKRWLVKIGIERAALVRCWHIASGWDPFIILIWVALHIGGRGDAFATAKTFELLFRAERAGKHLYEYLTDLERRGELERVLREVGVTMGLQIDAVRSLLNLESRFNLRKTPPGAIDERALYRQLQAMRGFADLAHYGMYQLIRLYGFRCPPDLRATDRLRRKLSLLGLTPDDFRPEELPYVDVATWDI